MLDDADRRGFERAGGEAVVDEALERGLQHHRVGGGEAGEGDGLCGFDKLSRALRYLRASGSRGNRRLTDPQGADDAATLSERGQCLRGPARGRCLAVVPRLMYD